MVTTPPDLGVVPEAPATIPENEFDPATGSTDGGILSPPCLSDTSGMDTSAWRDNESSRSLTDSPPSEYTDVAGIWEEVFAKGSSLDHFH